MLCTKGKLSGGGSAGSPIALCAPPELPLEVLGTMRCYVKHFFGCQECAQHFEAMAAKSMDQVKGRDEAVLWLWSHHNEVNARLAGKGAEVGRGGVAGWYPEVWGLSRAGFPRGRDPGCRSIPPHGGVGQQLR